MIDIAPPPGFGPYSEPSPFLDRIGPLFEKRLPDVPPVFGLRIADLHCNRKGFAHAGVLVALADITLGKTLARSREPRPVLVTASLATEFLSSARIGDWVEAACDHYRLGRTQGTANCWLTAGDRRLLRASAVFQIV